MQVPTVKILAMVLVFFFALGWCEASAQNLNLTFIGAYGFDDVFGRGFGLRAGFQFEDKGYLGARVLYHPFVSRSIDVGCPVCSSDGIETVDLNYRILYFTTEVGVTFRLAISQLRPAFLLGLAFSDFDGPVPDALDELPLSITPHKATRFVYAPGFIFEIPVRRFLLGTELFYLNLTRSDPEL